MTVSLPGHAMVVEPSTLHACPAATIGSSLATKAPMPSAVHGASPVWAFRLARPPARIRVPGLVRVRAPAPVIKPIGGVPGGIDAALRARKEHDRRACPAYGLPNRLIQQRDTTLSSHEYASHP